MSPTRFRRKDLPTVLALFLVCGCAVESRDDADDAKLGQAQPPKKACTSCPLTAYTQPPNCPAPGFAQAAPGACAPAVAYPPAPAVSVYTPVAYAVAPAPVAEATSLRERAQKRPVGAWEREVGNCRITLRFEEDRLFGTCTFRDNKEVVTVTMDADYSITKDSVLYGIITGSEAAGFNNAGEMVVYLDLPFSARIRQDGDTLTLKGVKFLDCGLKGKENLKDLMVLEGRYAKPKKTGSP